MQFAPIYPWLHKLLKPTFPNCLWEGNLGTKTIALTYDDGPHPSHTLQVLEVLAQYQVSASFFWLGASVERFPKVAKAVWQEGHWVGLHGYQHQSFTQLSPQKLHQDLKRTQLAIAEACQIGPTEAQQRIRDVRPPNGFFTPQILQVLEQGNYRPVMWSVVPEDWVRPGVAVAAQRVVEQTHNGSVIVLHDGYCGGEDAAETTAQIIPILLEQGFQFVTIGQFWEYRCPSP